MYILCSDYEGVSNSLLEAMAIGLPVIATDCPIGGTAMCIDDKVNGVLVPVGGEQELINAMTMLAEEQDLSTDISKNAVKIRERFSVEKVSEMWIETLKEERR